MITPNFAGFNPYIFKAYYDYIVDHDDIPHLLVNPQCRGVVLPPQFAAASELVLSISPAATHNFDITLHGLAFDTRFSGKSFSVFLPYECMQELIATESKIAIPIRVFFTADESKLEEDELFAEPSSGDGPDFEILDGSEEIKEEPKPNVSGSDLAEDDLLARIAEDDKSRDKSKDDKDDDPGFEPL